MRRPRTVSNHGTEDVREMTLEEALDHMRSLLSQITDKSIASADLILDEERAEIGRALECSIHLCEGLLA